jgi:6-phosphogluconolactonase (cycloisomerase 2 family)
MRRVLALAAVVGATLALAPSAHAAHRLYAPSYGSGTPETISGFERASDGALTQLSGSPYPGGPSGAMPAVSGLFAFAFTPDGGRAASSFLFKGGAQGLAVTPDASIAPAGDARTSPSATSLAISPEGRFAYTPTRTFQMVAGVGIVGYSIGADGSLTPLSTSPYSSGEMWDVALTPDGRFLYATTGAVVKRFSVGPDGALTELTPAAIPSVSSLETSPDGRFLFVGLNSATSDGVASYTIAPDGGLSQNGTPALTGNISLNYFAVAADGRHVYMPDSNADTVVTAAVADDGALAVIDSTPIDNVDAAVASPDGRYLYLLASGTIAVASLGADGKPTLLPSTVPFSSGEPVRLRLQPEPTPTAALNARPGFPGAESAFDASGSARAFRYDWDWGDGTTLADGGATPTHVYRTAGVYTARVTVTDEHGCSTRQIYTGQSTICPGGAAATATVPLDTLPALGRLALKNRRFAVPAARRTRVKRGTRFLYTLSEAAGVRFTIKRRLTGRRVRGRCRRVTRRNLSRPRCVRYKRVHAFAVAGRAGANSTKFSGKVRRRGLPAGRYRVTALATDQAGGKSLVRTAAFRIVRAPARSTGP